MCCKQLSRNRRDGSQDPGLWQTGFHHRWNARDLYSRSPLGTLVHDFEGLWILNAALGLLHIGILGRDMSSLPGCTLIAAWNIASILRQLLFGFGRYVKFVYGMKGNSALCRWSAARQRRVQEEFAELLRCLAMHSQETLEDCSWAETTSDGRRFLSRLIHSGSTSEKRFRSGWEGQSDCCRGHRSCIMLTYWDVQKHWSEHWAYTRPCHLLWDSSLLFLVFNIYIFASTAHDNDILMNFHRWTCWPFQRHSQFPQAEMLDGMNANRKSDEPGATER